MGPRAGAGFKWAASLGVGLMPGPGGTYGSALTTAGVWVWLAAGGGPLSGWLYGAFLVIAAALAVWVSQQALDAGVFGQDHDPNAITIDEGAGQLIALYGAALGPWWHLPLAFVAFRLFDVFKPFPIDSLQKLPGGWGITADDLLAGVYALGLTWAVRWLAG